VGVATSNFLVGGLVWSVKTVAGGGFRAAGTVPLANFDLIDRLGVVVYSSIPVRAPIVRTLGRCFRFLPAPRAAAV
jgi:hypothetical protein